MEEAQLAAGGGYAPKPDGYGAHPISQRECEMQRDVHGRAACSKGAPAGMHALHARKQWHRQCHHWAWRRRECRCTPTELRALHLCCSGAPGRGGGFGGGGRGFAGRTAFDYDVSSANCAKQSGNFKHDPGSQVTEFLHGALQGHPAEAAALAGAAAGSQSALAITTAMALQILQVICHSSISGHDSGVHGA